jgi:hypothetical protein
MAKGGLRSTSFKPGVSGNPDGRPKRPETIEARRVVADVKAAARELTLDAMNTFKGAMADPKAPWAAKIAAAIAILDRGWGKPMQAVEANVSLFAGSDGPDRLPHRLSFVGAEIVEDHDVARLRPPNARSSPLRAPSLSGVASSFSASQRRR